MDQKYNDLNVNEKKIYFECLLNTGNLLILALKCHNCNTLINIEIVGRI